MTALRAVRTPMPFADALEAAEEHMVHFKPLMNRREAEILFEIDAAQSGESMGWKAYFVENLTEYLVFGERPTGRIRDEDVKWLISCIGTDVSPSVPALLRALVLQAEQVPQSLISLAMRHGAMRQGAVRG